MKKKLPYDFVDATVVKLDISKGKRLRIIVKLGKIFNPKEEEVTLIFNGIEETQRIFDLSRNVHQMKLANDSMVPKVQNISFDAITEPKEGKHHFYIEIKGVKGIRITCNNYTIKTPDTSQT